MANARLAHPNNVPGDFFVDTTCIDCPTCRQIAPDTFGDAEDQAVVMRQPDTKEKRLRAAMALVSCPVGSIGTNSSINSQPALNALPELLSGGVYACGFASPDSFGAQSYFIKHPEGNVLVDSPRFAGPLVKKFEELGGIRYMFLTHRDDVADHKKFHQHFGCERIIHEDEATGELASVERKLTGGGPWLLTPNLKAIATPGHTEGHVVLLYRETFLFTGDHIWWNGEGLESSRRHNWYSWEIQTKSVEKLLAETFTWILPGHGYRICLTHEQMHQELAKALKRMRG